MKRYTVLIIILMIGVFPVQKAKAYNTPSLDVQIFSADGALESSFEIATENEIGGAKVVVADLGNDGTAEIIVGNGMGSGPTVSIYRSDGSEIRNFQAYSDEMRRGITVTVCDPDGDGMNDIITGTQYGAGPHVKLFDSDGEQKDQDGIMVYDGEFRGGKEKGRCRASHGLGPRCYRYLHLSIRFVWYVLVGKFFYP